MVPISEEEVTQDDVEPANQCHHEIGTHATNTACCTFIPQEYAIDYEIKGN